MQSATKGPGLKEMRMFGKLSVAKDSSNMEDRESKVSPSILFYLLLIN